VAPSGTSATAASALSQILDESIYRHAHEENTAVRGVRSE